MFGFIGHIMNNINKLYLFSIMAILVTGTVSPAFAVHEHDPSTSGATALTLTNTGTGTVTVSTTNSILAIESAGANGVLDLNTVTAGIAIEAGDTTLNDPVDGAIDLRSVANISIISGADVDIATTGAGNSIQIDSATDGIGIAAGGAADEPGAGELLIDSAANMDLTAGGTGTLNVATTNNILSIQAAGANGVLDLNTVTAGIAIEAGDTTLNDPADGAVIIRAATNFGATALGTGTADISTVNNILSIQAAGANGVLDLNTVTAGIAIEAGDTTLNDPTDGDVVLRAGNDIVLVATSDINTVSQITSTSAVATGGLQMTGALTAGGGDIVLRIEPPAETITGATNVVVIDGTNLTVEAETHLVEIDMGSLVPTADYVGLRIVSTENDVDVFALVVAGGGPLSTGIEIESGDFELSGATQVIFTPEADDVAAASSITSGALYIQISDAGNNGGITTSTTDSIVAGTQTGQLLIIQNIDTDAADTITIDANANILTPAAGVIALTIDDIAMFIWDGDEWVHIASTLDNGNG